MCSKRPTPFSHHSSECARHSSAGFTLIELMVVVLIIGILVGIAVIALSGSQDTSRDRTAMANLRNIQSLAAVSIADQSPVSLANLNVNNLDEAANVTQAADQATANSSAKQRAYVITGAVGTTPNGTFCANGRGSGSNIKTYFVQYQTSGTIVRGLITGAGSCPTANPAGAGYSAWDN